MQKRNLAWTTVVGLLCLISSLAYPAYGEESRKLLPATVVQGSFDTVDDSISKIYVSYAYGNKNPKVQDGADLTAAETQAIHDLINGTGFFEGIGQVPMKNRWVKVVRYEVGQPLPVDALIEAKKKGFKEVNIVTDFEESLNGHFPHDEKFNSNFKGSYKKSAEAKELQRLIAGGFEINGTQYGVCSQPLYNKKKVEIAPIMHEKTVILGVDLPDGTSRVVVYSGSGNWTAEPRLNRTVVTSDPLVVQYYSKHADLLMEAYRAGKETKDVESMPPLRVVYKDGTWQEVAFTDGKYDLNQRQVDYFLTPLTQKATAADNVREILNSEFVFTNALVYKAHLKALETFPELTWTHYADGRTAAPDGYDFTPTEAGYIKIRPGFAGPMVPVPAELRKRIQAYGYLKGIPGDPETDPDGAPDGRALDHDKLSIYRVTESGEPITYVAEGSYNLSGHAANAEVQVLYRFNEASPLGQSFVESVHKLKDSDPKAWVSVKDLTFLMWIAKMTGHTDFEVPLDLVLKLEQTLEKNNLKAFEKELRGLAKEKGNLSHRPSQEILGGRIDKLVQALDWLQKNRKNADLSAPRVVALGDPVAYNLKGKNASFAIESAIYDSKVPKLQLEKQMHEVGKLLGLDVKDLNPSFGETDQAPLTDEEHSHVREIQDHIHAARCANLLK